MIDPNRSERAPVRIKGNPVLVNSKMRPIQFEKTNPLSGES
jgi:hypothetical protein